MITTILRTATRKQLDMAVVVTAERLHLPVEEVSRPVAVAYINRHFKIGTFTAWDGFVEYIEP